MSTANKLATASGVILVTGLLVAVLVSIPVGATIVAVGGLLYAVALIVLRWNIEVEKPTAKQMPPHG